MAHSAFVRHIRCKYPPIALHPYSCMTFRTYRLFSPPSGAWRGVDNPRPSSVSAARCRRPLPPQPNPVLCPSERLQASRRHVLCPLRALRGAGAVISPVEALEIPQNPSSHKLRLIWLTFFRVEFDL